MNKYKILLLPLVFCMVSGVVATALAQENDIPELILDETVVLEDLDVSEPTLLPDSKLYFLKNWGRGIQSFFTLDKVKKLELESKFANERIVEIKKLVEENKNPDVIKKATEKYQKTLNRIKARSEKIKDKAQQNPKVEKFLEKYSTHQILHQSILEKLENQVPEEVFEKIRTAREEHLERFRDVTLKLEEKNEIGKRLERIFENQEGSDFKDFKNLELLRRLRDKMPDDVKEKIINTEEKVIERFKNSMEKMPTERQEIFQKYINKLPGDKEKHLEILENLRGELENNPGLKGRINNAREKVMERIQLMPRKINCPEIDRPASNFCVNGRVVVKKDDNGCVIDFECVTPERTSADISVCTQVWAPVCGNDGKTYSNDCFARVAGATIRHKGKCKTIINAPKSEIQSSN